MSPTLEELILERDEIIRTSNLNDAELNLNEIYPEIIAGIATIEIDINTILLNMLNV